jgi:hypothetical protein
MDNDRIAGSAGEATETLRDGSRAVAKKVGEYTLGALLVAGGVGFALAVLMGGSAAPPAPALARLLGPGARLLGPRPVVFSPLRP